LSQIAATTETTGLATDPSGSGLSPGGPAPKRKMSLLDRIEAFISRLSTRNHFWHSVCSLIWLPYAFRSGIRMKRIDASTFTAVLPFRRFNRNWYNAMAGASLLANSEIAGGMYVFAEVGKDYRVVCKELSYRFLRPCFGPAIYRIAPKQDLKALMATGKEFNVDLDMDIVQGLVIPGTGKKGRAAQAAPPRAEADAAPPGTTEPTDAKPRKPGKEKRVGRCTVTFHVYPKDEHKARKHRRAG
jgi:hypothetical protein